MMNLCVTAASRIGCVRSNNEDMILVGSSFIRNDDYSTNIGLDPQKRILFAVADGMGGHKSGEVASSDALHNLHFFFNDIPTGLTAGATAVFTVCATAHCNNSPPTTPLIIC